ncbi:uncharacterized protein H6S33_002394 [Morchella sextelata]|uniref:uncharacterized protein n=1 Tax=Morchella sextelata TaxID=1174677 RepID=UPI001D053993|nr:uncharacterized protein H6S33_002394 [Morchella sextelata]KAH0607360.1 hypothetical protein H6S33_002394 [Morchella sextelata]
MGCCCSTEKDQYAAQSRRRLATDPAVVNAARYPYGNPPVQTASRQRPKAKPKTNSKPARSIPDSVITSVDELVWPALDQPQTQRPDPKRGPARHLSVLSVDPQKEFRNMPELVSPVLPPEGVYYEGYTPPVPEKVPEEHPRFDRNEPPPRPPKELEGMQRGRERPIECAPALPPKPDHMRGETAPAPLTKDPHSMFAELPSQRRVAELAGLPPPAELDGILIPNPLHEQVRIKYRDAVPYAPDLSELPAQVLPVSPSGSLYSPYLVGSEMNQGLRVSAIQPRVASPGHPDSIHQEMDAAGAIYELDDRQRSSQRQVVESLIPSPVYATGTRSRYVRQRAGGRT